MDTTLFISGTASITQSETRHPGEVVAQTNETIENIAALISEENLSRHGLPGRGAKLHDLSVARVYVKRPEDYPAVRLVCAKRLAGVPINYLVADVCRPDLLVEIEGIAFSREPLGNGSALARCLQRRGARVSAEAALKLARCGHICPSGCPERDTCPHAVLH
jgi:enamine deaminase RidA (YjgF/YER057c/UK114 family)